MFVPYFSDIFPTMRRMVVLQNTDCKKDGWLLERKNWLNDFKGQSKLLWLIYALRFYIHNYIFV